MIKEKLVEIDQIKELKPSYFFDLSNYLHAELFSNPLVWEALSLLESYLADQTLGKIEIEIPHGVHLIDRGLISIGKGTVIEPGAYIKGPCLIGKNCTIRHGAYIRGNLITGDHCVVGHTTEIKNAIFLNHAVAAHFAYIGDSILGNDVNLGAGTKCANLRLDRANIAASVNGRKIDTGRHKLGAIFGDGSQTGCNSVTNPGTFFGKNACCYPCMNVGGFIPSGRMLKPKESE